MLVQLGQQVEQQGAARLAKGQVAQFVQDQHVRIHQPVGNLTRLAVGFLGFQGIDQFHGRVEAHPFAMALNGLNAQRRGQMRLAGARPANEHHVVRRVREGRSV